MTRSWLLAHTRPEHLVLMTHWHGLSWEHEMYKNNAVRCTPYVPNAKLYPTAQKPGPINHQPTWPRPFPPALPLRLTVCAGCNHACECWGSSVLMITSCFTSYYSSYDGICRGTVISWSLLCTLLDHHGWVGQVELVIWTGYYRTH